MAGLWKPEHPAELGAPGQASSWEKTFLSHLSEPDAMHILSFGLLAPSLSDHSSCDLPRVQCPIRSSRQPVGHISISSKLPIWNIRLEEYMSAAQMVQLVIRIVILKISHVYCLLSLFSDFKIYVSFRKLEEKKL